MAVFQARQLSPIRISSQPQSMNIEPNAQPRPCQPADSLSQRVRQFHSDVTPLMSSSAQDNADRALLRMREPAMVSSAPQAGYMDDDSARKAPRVDIVSTCSRCQLLCT